MLEVEEDNLDKVDLILKTALLSIADCVVNCNGGISCSGDDDYDSVWR